MQKSLFLAAALIAAACSREPEAPPIEQAPIAAAEATAPEMREITAAGTVAWPQGAALPGEAFLRVRLTDVSRQDAAAEPLAEATYPVGAGSPVNFSLTTDSEIDPRARLSVSAQISDGAALFYVSDTNNPVSPDEGAQNMSITLVPVDAAPGSGAGGAPVTPVPVAYQCAGERFEIAIEAGAAYVTGAEGETAKLDKLAGGDSAPQSFTDGRLTVFFDGSDMDGLKLRVARGKAAAQACVRTQ